MKERIIMKKLTALLLVLLLLAGCTTNTPPATEPSAAPTAAPTAPPTEAPTEAPTEPAPLEGLTVHFIDVGQADCALIECDNAYVLIDAGDSGDEEKILTYLETLGVQRLNLLVGTHPHADHIGSMPAVFDALQIDNVWFSAMPYTNGYVQDFVNAVKNEGVVLQQPKPGTEFHLGDATITVIGPVKTGYEDINDESLVLMVQYGDVRFLFTGDMEALAEEDLLDSGADVKADVLKVGHHGSYSSTSYRFLREVAPTYAVIPVGAANDYGHPHREPLSRLKDAEVIIFRTDKMYDIVAVTDGTDIQFTWGNTFAKPWTPAA